MKHNWIFRAAALVLCLMLVLAGCAPAQSTVDNPTPTPSASSDSQSDSQLSLPAGVYTGSAEGFHGPIEVEVTLDETSSSA